MRSKIKKLKLAIEAVEQDDNLTRFDIVNDLLSASRAMVNDLSKVDHVLDEIEAFIKNETEAKNDSCEHSPN